MQSGEEHTESAFHQQSTRRAGALSETVGTKLTEGMPTGDARRVAAPDAAPGALLGSRRRAMVRHRDVARVVRS